MGKRLTGTKVARYARNGLRSPVGAFGRNETLRHPERPERLDDVSGAAPRQWWHLIATVLACVTIAGCAMRDDGSDRDRRGGFYGGVTGGMSRP